MKSQSKKQGEHRGVRRAADKMQDTLGGIAGRMSAKTVTDAKTFVESAAVSDRFEIESAKIALARAGIPAVKRAALRMLEQHTTSTHQLEAALETNEARRIATPPEQLDKRRSEMLEHLRAAPADKFDVTYLDQQVMAHEEALNLMQNYQSQGDNPQLASVAAGAAPVIARHLEHMRTLRAEL